MSLGDDGIVCLLLFSLEVVTIVAEAFSIINSIRMATFDLRFSPYVMVITNYAHASGAMLGLRMGTCVDHLFTSLLLILFGVLGSGLHRIRLYILRQISGLFKESLGLLVKISIDHLTIVDKVEIWDRLI